MDYVPPLLLGVIMGAVTSYTDIKTGFIFDNHVFPTLTLIGKLLGWGGRKRRKMTSRAGFQS